MKKPAKSAAELEALIKLEMEDVSDRPTDLLLSVLPDGDSWKIEIIQDGVVGGDERREMISLIADRLRGEFDLNE